MTSHSPPLNGSPFIYLRAPAEIQDPIPRPSHVPWSLWEEQSRGGLQSPQSIFSSAPPTPSHSSPAVMPLSPRFAASTNIENRQSTETPEARMCAMNARLIEQNKAHAVDAAALEMTCLDMLTYNAHLQQQSKLLHERVASISQCTSTLERENSSFIEKNNSIERGNVRLNAECSTLRQGAHRVSADVQNAIVKARSLTDLYDQAIKECSCNICGTLLIRPWSLTLCGHAFCEHCLLNWFARKHLEASPHILVCPVCQVELGSAPIVDIELNQLVSKFPEAPPRDQLRERMSWERFFPSKQ